MRKHNVAILVASALFFALLLIFVTGPQAVQPREKVHTRFENGKDLDFKATRLDGSPFDARGLKGKIVLLDFWAVWCPPCITAFPKLNRMQRDFKKENFEVLGIAVHSGTRQDVATFVHKYELDYLIVVADEDLVARFGVIGFPTYFLMNQHGIVYKQYVGDSPDLYVEIARDISNLRKLSLQEKEAS